MYLTAMISAAPMILIVARAEARSRFGACVSASANSIERKSALMYVTARAGTVQGKSVHRFIARSAFRRFSRSGFAPNHRESSLHRGPDDFVFCKKDGSALDPDVLRKDALYPILDRLGIPRKKGASGFHTFRHSAASIVNEQTENLKLAQRFLGHSTIEMTAESTRTLQGNRNTKPQSLWKAQSTAICSQVFPTAQTGTTLRHSTKQRNCCDSTRNYKE